MEFTTLCAVIATLRVLPNRSQFFQYESLSLSCEQQGNSSEWRVRRNTATKTNEQCSTTWDERDESNCVITDLYPSDSGVYWCESGAGERSNTVNISVTAGFVILESPALPVMDGEALTLHCSNRIPPSSFSLTSYFYKDGLLMATSSTGNLTIDSVSKSDEGLYKCSISGAGESPDSWLAVREAVCPELFESTLALLLLPVVVKCLSLILLSLSIPCFLWRNHKDEKQRRHSCSFSSVPVHRPGRSIYTSKPVMTCKACR